MLHRTESKAWMFIVSIFSTLINRWREFLMVFCLFIGGGLIYSTKELIPVFLNIIEAKQQRPAIPIYSAEDYELRIETPDEKYNNFLPIIQNSKKDDVQPVHQKDSTSLISVTEVEIPFLDINFDEGSPAVRMIFEPQKLENTQENSVRIKFLPGNHCTFGDGYGCVFQFQSPIGISVIFVSVHSGMGGEADDFRNLLEGTGINQGLFTPNQVQNNIQALMGSPVRIRQGEKEISGLSLETIVRIPPEQVSEYRSLSLEEAVDFALEFSKVNLKKLNHNLLIIETCGWRLPGEEQVEGLDVTASSVYLGIIQMDEDQN